MATLLFDVIQKLGARGIGPRLRSMGLRIYSSGLRLAGSDATFEMVLPQAERVKVGEKLPVFQNVKLVAQGSSIMGDVTIGEDTAIHSNNIISAVGNGRIVIGKNSIIQDLVIIKADEGHAVNIGDNVLIGPNAYLRNCTVKDNGVVGAGAKAYDGSVIEGMLGAGSVLLEGQTIADGEIWAGNPAALIRHMTEDEREHNRELLYNYSKVADIILEEMATSIEEDMALQDVLNVVVDRDSAMAEYKQLKYARNEGLPFADEDFVNAKRLIDLEFVNDTKEHLAGQKFTNDYPYAYEGFPRNFNIQKPNYRVHNELKGKVDTEADMQRPDYGVFEKGGDVSKPDNWTRKY